MLIDWDTVGLALPERDLWLVAGAASDEMSMYADATGRPVSPAAMRSAGLGVADIASYLEVFRSPHGQTADTEEAWGFLSVTVRVTKRPSHLRANGELRRANGRTFEMPT